MKWKPRLRNVLLIVNLVILLLPLAGIVILRVYETELVKRTETALIAQGVTIEAAYRQVLLRALGNSKDTRSGIESTDYGTPLPAEFGEQHHPEESLKPILPRLDLTRDRIRPPAPDATEPRAPASPAVLEAGSSITPMLLRAKSVTLAGIRVTDHQGTVVATTGSELGMSLQSREEVSLALTGKPVRLLRERVTDRPAPSLKSVSRGGRIRVFVAVPVIHEGRILGAVVLSRTPLDILKALYLNRLILFSAAGVLLLVVILVSLFTSLTISRPVGALIRQSDLISRGEKGAAVPLSSPGTHEVDLLSRAFAHMAATLERRAEYIRTFASNVSHSFKTPLASMRGTVELLQDHLEEMGPEDRNRFLTILQEDTERLQRLVRRLLDLARAETTQPGADKVELKGLLEEIAERYTEAGLTVTLEDHSEPTILNMAPETFESIMSSILDNVIQHGGEGAQVRIGTGLLEGIDGKSLEITVTDNGTGISDANATRVFKPFFTTAGEKGGTGLGLPIARALIRAHGGSIVLDRLEKGTRFTIALPL